MLWVADWVHLSANKMGAKTVLALAGRRDSLKEESMDVLTVLTKGQPMAERESQSGPVLVDLGFALLPVALMTD